MISSIGKIVAAQVQPRVEEHAAVARREDEAVAVEPARFVRIVLEGVAVKHGADFRAAERQAEVAGVGGVNGVHAETARLIAARERISRFKLMRTGIIGASVETKLKPETAAIPPLAGLNPELE